MTCEVCAFVLDTNPPDGVNVLTIATPCYPGMTVDPEKFAGVFGIWDHSQHKTRYICGACLCAKLFGSWRDRPSQL